jgi:hypothetical protein
MHRACHGPLGLRRGGSIASSGSDCHAETERPPARRLPPGDGMHPADLQICRCGRRFRPDRRIPPVPRAFCSRACYYASQKVPVDRLFRRDRGRCHLCGKRVRLADASRDHLLPRCRGGGTVWSNLALAHRRCNSLRGDLPLVRWRSLTR